MSSFQARALPDRVVLIHDLTTSTIVSELHLDQAEILLKQLALAMGLARPERWSNAADAIPPDLAACPG